MKTMESIPLKDVVNYQAPTKPEALQKLDEFAGNGRADKDKLDRNSQTFG